MHRSYSYAGNSSRARYSTKNEFYMAAELFEAVEEQSLSDVLMLLERDGANPNTVLPNKGIAPFHLVVGSDSENFAEEATRLFLQHDGNPNVKSDEGLTPVHVAAVWGRVRLLALLLACGGDPWIMDREGSQTALQLATQHHRWDAALLLQRYQLLDKKSRSSVVSPSQTQPKFSLQLERVVVSNGEVQAEYAASREGDNGKICEMKNVNERSPFVVPSQRAPDNDILSPWNRNDKLRTSQEYVREWCQRQQLSSPEVTPVRTPLRTPVRTPPRGEATTDSPKTPNISGYSSVSTARADSSPKELPKKICRNGDVRRNLFLELKKRFSSPKSGHSSESDTEKRSRKVFSRFIGKKKKSSSGDEAKKPKALPKSSVVGDSSESNSVAAESLSPEDMEVKLVNETLPTPDNSPDEFASVIGTERFGTPLNSSLITEDEGVDEVDAIPLPSGSDTPVNGLSRSASQEEFLLFKLLAEQRRRGATSPDSLASQLYYTCDEDAPEANVPPKTTSSPLLAPVLQFMKDTHEKSTPASKSVVRSKSAPRLLRFGESPKKRVKTPAPPPPSFPPPSVLPPPPPPPPLPPPTPPKEMDPDKDVFKVPQRPPRRKQSLRFKNASSENKENPPPCIEESLSKVFKPSIASSPCVQHAVLQYIPSESSSDSHSTATFVSVAEEYVYKDEEHGVVLVEKRLIADPASVPNLEESLCVGGAGSSGAASSLDSTVNGGDSDVVSDVSSLPASFTYESDRLRKELESRGVAVGPITTTTKRVYLRQLYRLHKKGIHGTNRSPGDRVYCPEVDRVLKMPEDWQFEIAKYASLEEAMCAPFDNPDPGRRWREGHTKSSFNYLLLDPRISQNLPRQLTCFNKGNIPLEAWRNFLSAIFYIGKGKRSRPYAHLYQAVRLWGKDAASHTLGPKVARILDIWQSNQGVVCLHVYQNIIPVEALTREAAMIEAIGLNNVVNLKGGEYYGPAATWAMRQKRRLGIYLLYRALCVFVSEGERQLRPNDIN